MIIKNGEKMIIRFPTVASFARATVDKKRRLSGALEGGINSPQPLVKMNTIKLDYDMA